MPYLSSRIAPLRVTAPSQLTVGASAVQGPNIPCHGVRIKANSPAQKIFVGTTSGVLTTTGWPLADSQELDLEVNNVNKLWFIASAAAQAVGLLPYSLY